MRILSWNILANEFISKRSYPMIPAAILFNRKKRQERIIATLKQADADVMLLQEVMLSEYKQLSTHFHSTHHIIRSKYITWQNKRSYSGNVTLLRKNMFTSIKPPIELSFGHVIQCSLSIAPLSIAPLSIAPLSIATLMIANIHLDDVSNATRLRTLKTEFIQPFKSDYPTIIGGDFNERYNPESKLYSLLKGIGLKPLLKSNTPTYYIEAKMSIDNIFIKGLGQGQGQVINAYGNDIVQQFLNYGSDHLPVLVHI